MAVTEFVFPRLTKDPHLLQGLKTALPPAAKAAFSDVPGLLSYHRGRIVKAQNISEGTGLEHSGLAIVLEWEDIASFNSFWISDKFASFRETMKPYLLGPVAPDLFCSKSQIESGGTTTNKYLQYVKVSRTRASDSEVESAWQALVSSLEKKAKSVFSAWGAQDTNAFAGVLGWDSLEDFEAATQTPTTERCLKNMSAYGLVSSYLLEV
ncbi:hypothetical protein B0T10DRAFT_563042 [Thelonectria olida]|uniref:Uncharacterized protein n=1 Tax=Thelonectria olida TaxID=1576542 RepID=A0A9P8W0V6_9HYPO|nr:hypothetical protein B0T10DRAFT_563042 [Thelonectria olida]